MPDPHGQPAPLAAVRLQLDCALPAVRPVTLEARLFLERHGVGAPEAASCELALAEACNNAIHYAPEAARSLPIGIDALLHDRLIELRVDDHTGGFELPQRVALPDDASERGRGLFIIQSVMDQVDYLRGRQGNCLVMRRRRTSSPTAAVTDPDSRCRDLERRLAADEQVIRDMADELSSCYESLAAIFRYSGETSRPASMDEFAGRLLNDLLRVTGHDWYVLRLLRPPATQLLLFAASEAALELQPLSLRNEATDGDPLELQAAVQHRDVFFEPGADFRAEDPLGPLLRGSVGLVHPIYAGESLVGTLALGGRRKGLKLPAAQVSVIQTFADFLAIQIVSAEMQENRVQNLLVAQEIRIARNIQRSLLPATLPEPVPLRLAGSCESANDVGGDFYDVLRISDTAVLVIISDVMGKGLPAAMFALILRSLVRALRDLAPRPGTMLQRINDLLHDELSRVEMFITAQLVFVDAATDRLVVASAGHCPLLAAAADNTPVRVYAPDGMPLGVLPDTEFAEDEVTIRPGDRFLLYTDGVTETAPSPDDLFGQSRLMEWLAAAAGQGAPANAMKEGLIRRLAAHQASLSLSDDQTFVIVAR